jgi:hypothetical protein
LALSRLKLALRKDAENTQYCLKLDVKKYYPNINHDILKAKLSKIFKDKKLLWLLGEIIDSVEGEIGLPIGNYTSQYLGNFYLSEFDHWLKEVKRVKYVYRYMDDVIILGRTKDELHQLKLEIVDYLKVNLNLELKGNEQIFPIDKRPIDFVGYVVHRKYVLLRKSIKKELIRKMKLLTNKSQLNLSDKSSIGSYNGWLVYCNGINLRNKYIEPLLRKESA